VNSTCCGCEDYGERLFVTVPSINVHLGMDVTSGQDGLSISSVKERAQYRR